MMSAHKYEIEDDHRPLLSDPIPHHQVLAGLNYQNWEPPYDYDDMSGEVLAAQAKVCLGCEWSLAAHGFALFCSAPFCICTLGEPTQGRGRRRKPSLRKLAWKSQKNRTPAKAKRKAKAPVAGQFSFMNDTLSAFVNRWHVN